MERRLRVLSASGDRVEEGAMGEFLESYGLWVALAAVFLAMHWFGKGCCGGAHRHGLAADSKGPAEEVSGDEKTSGKRSKPGGCCH